MLQDIAPLPTAENSAIRLHPADNVAVARVPLAAGTKLRIGEIRVTVLDPIPTGHKLAIQPVSAGATVQRYGQSIGRARLAIEAGRHVHTHNFSFEEVELNYEFPAADTTLPAPPKDVPTFLGYRREDGRVGTRNYIAV